MVLFAEIKEIVLSRSYWQEILYHCKRKLAGNYLPGESEGRRAYGLVAGVRNGTTLEVKRILPVRRNVRDEDPYKTYMDRMMEAHAVPSKTPMSRRGWMTDPEELKKYYDTCDREGLIVFGSYHMHVVPWEHDPRRDTPTKLDTVLAQNTNLFSFIVSMVDIGNPSIRAFYEARLEREVPLISERRQSAGSV
jgi:hypothetical protein